MKPARSAFAENFFPVNIASFQLRHRSVTAIRAPQGRPQSKPSFGEVETIAHAAANTVIFDPAHQRLVHAALVDQVLQQTADRVVGALTVGEFSWGTFMRTLGDYSAFASTNTIAGHDVPHMIGKMAQIELSHGGKTWAQLYAAMALHSYGRDLNHNSLWQSLSPEGKETYRSLLDPSRFYDAKTHTLIHLPENYFGVAARIAAIDYDLGLNKDRTSLDDLLNRAAAQFTAGALFADDSLPTGRYDRYSNEYARAIYDAAQLAGREDLVKAVSPSLKQQMALWWDLLSPDGYGYPWGRSLGAITSLEIMGLVECSLAGEIRRR